MNADRHFDNFQMVTSEMSSVKYVHLLFESCKRMVKCER